MNIKDWQAQVWDCPNMNPTAVAICLAIGSHGNWNDSQTVWPSRQRIAGMTGASRDNVGKYMTALEEQGWLRVVKLRKDNVREYELTKPEVAVVRGILAVRERGNSENLKNQVVVDNDEVAVVRDKQVVGSYDKQVVVVRDTNLPENLPEELTKEHTTTSTGPSDAVQLEEVLPLGEEGTTPSLTLEQPKASFKRQEQLESYIVGTRYLPNLSREQKDQIRDLCLDPMWSVDESRPNYRTQAAIKEVLDNERVQV